MKMKYLMLLAVAASAILVSGCGKDLGYRKTTGVVTLEGAPLAGAIVTFVAQGQGAESGAATTNEKGEYSANSGSVGANLVPEEYSSAATTSLSATVTDNPKQNVFNFEL